MSRLPFNPDKLPDQDAGPPAARERKRYGAFAADEPLQVSQAVQLIKRVLADRTPSPLKVVGEISNFNSRGGKHWFFSLKDADNVLSAVMWQSAANRSPFTPENGQQVVATGRLDLYGPQGRLQLYIDKIEPVGQGTLELQFRQLCEELRKAGYFEDARKKPLPRFPMHIAIITSKSSAAVQDVIRTSKQRWPGIRLSVFDVRVQGESAAPEIARAIGLLSTQHESLGIDSIIVTRGGGSLEDLWAFNERIVADALLECKVPVIAAIGHETDTTIAELVADRRCSTPTQAAAVLVPERETELHRLQQATDRLSHSLRRSGEAARARLDGLANHAVFARPTDRLQRHRDRVMHTESQLRFNMVQHLQKLRSRLDQDARSIARIEPSAQLAGARQRFTHIVDALPAALTRQMQRLTERLDHRESVLKAIGPMSVLHRGYTYTTDAAGNLLRTASEAKHAERLKTHFNDGVVDSHVQKDAVAPKRKKRKLLVDEADPGLFGTE